MFGATRSINLALAMFISWNFHFFSCDGFGNPGRAALGTPYLVPASSNAEIGGPKVHPTSSKILNIESHVRGDCARRGINDAACVCGLAMAHYPQVYQYLFGSHL